MKLLGGLGSGRARRSDRFFFWNGLPVSSLAGYDGPSVDSIAGASLEFSIPNSHWYTSLYYDRSVTIYVTLKHYI